MNLCSGKAAVIVCVRVLQHKQWNNYTSVYMETGVFNRFCELGYRISYQRDNNKTVCKYI